MPYVTRLLLGLFLFAAGALSTADATHPAPTAPMSFACRPLGPTFLASSPGAASPLGVMTASNQVALLFELDATSPAVDVYVAAQLPDQSLWLLNSAGQWLSYPASVPAFRTQLSSTLVFNTLTQNLFTTPIANLPPGAYQVYTIVVPTGTDPKTFQWGVSPYYLWCFTQTVASTNPPPPGPLPPPPPTVSLAATPNAITSGASSTLNWSSTNATSCDASGAWSGAKATSGSEGTGVLTQNSSFTLTCSGTGGSTNQTVSVAVGVTPPPPPPPAPTVSLAATPNSITSGGSTTLNWSSTNATSCDATGAWSGTKATSGNEGTGVLTQNSGYSLTCTGAGGSAGQTATVTVSAPPPPPPLPSGLSALATLANSMSPGSWAELTTDNLLPTLTNPTCGATGSIFPYTEDAVWDPVSRRVLFIGSDHVYCDTLAQRFIAYSEVANAWSTLANPPWFSNGVRHGYDHSAMDASNGIYFHFPYGDSSRPMHRYDTTTNTWLSDTPNAPNNSCCMGVEYFPEFVGSNSAVAAGGAVMAGGGNVYAYRAATNSWTGALNTSRLNFGDFHVVAEYNPVHKVTIFGGGDIYSPAQSFSTLYKLLANGTITSLTSAPFNLRVNQSIVTVDPVGGDYLVFGPNGEFYTFDVVNNTWTLQNSTPPFASPKRESGVTTVDLTVAAPISTYGVVMFIKHIPGSNAQTKVYLYKHKAAAGGLVMPGAADEKATYLKWGWTWNASVEPEAVTEPVSNYYVGNPDIHGDTEGDDLWTYVMQYRRSGNPVYLNRAQAWLRYFKQDYRNNVGNPDYTLAYDASNFEYDHMYGWGLVTWYEHTAQLGAPDTAALTEAQNLAAIVENYWYQLNNNGTPRFVAGQHRMGNYGMRQGARHLLLATRLAESTQLQRWITLRDKLIELWMQSPDWTWDDAGHTRGMYYYGAWDTNGSISGSGSTCQYNDVAGCPYHDGARIISPFQIGILTEAFDHAYRVTGRTDLRDRMIALARYVAAYGMDTTYQYTASRFGIVNGQKWHNYSAGCGAACTWWDPVYSTSLVNTLVRGYKYTGDTSFYSLAKHYFNRGSKGVYGSTTQRAAGDTVAHHFVDTRFATASENFYLDYNRGELFYTYLLFENGGLAVP